MPSTCLQNRSNMVSKCLPFVVLFIQLDFKANVGQEEDSGNIDLRLCDKLMKKVFLVRTHLTAKCVTGINLEI